MKIIKKVIFIIILLIFIIGAVLFFNGKKMYETAISEISLDDKIKQVRNNSNFVKIDDVPEYYLNAIIAVEDRRFKAHGAVDPLGIIRATYSNIMNLDLSQGGSTITQQVSENLYFIWETDVITSKVAEIFMAYELEKNYSKNDILELYINTIYFGDGYYGIKQACKGYLNKKPQDMTLYESTMMAGIPNAPSVYAPTANPDLTLKRQKKVVRDMVKERLYNTRTSR